MAASRDDVNVRLPLSGSSREIDALTDTFNALMTSVDDGRGTDAGGLHGRDSRPRDGARRARSVHGRPFRARQRAVGRDRPTLRPARTTSSRSSAWARCCTTSARSACRTPCCSSPGALTPAEFDIIKQHPGAGARILQSVPFLAPHIPIVELHHERPDGTRLSAWPARRRHPDRRAHRPRGRRVRRDDDGARLPRSARIRRGAAGALAVRRHAVSRRSRRRSRDAFCRASSRRRARSSSKRVACVARPAAAGLLRRLALARSPFPPPRRRRTSASASTPRSAIDLFGGDNVSNRPQIIVDIIGTVQLGDRWQIYVRPWFRLPRPSPPTARHRPTGTRSSTRPACATSDPDRSRREWTPATSRRRSASGSSTRTREPIRRSRDTRATSRRCCPSTPAARACPRSPRRIRSARVLTLSGAHWDARAAIVNSSPVRNFAIGARPTHARRRSSRQAPASRRSTGLRLGVTVRAAAPT